MAKGLPLLISVISAGDVCSLTSDNADDANLFLRALATLEVPASGEYFFQGERLDFSSYVNLLPYKRRIGYISPEASLIGNRTLRENLFHQDFLF